MQYEESMKICHFSINPASALDLNLGNETKGQTLVPPFFAGAPFCQISAN
jgi:hypothetical protein